MKTPAIQVIQAMLAPGVMVSACALLLLGMNNRYSIIVNRIRLLKQEERNLDRKSNEESCRARTANIDRQLGLLLERLRLVRNAVFGFSVGMAFFLASSLLIGLQFVTDVRFVQSLVMVCFLAGMMCIMAGMIMAGIEVRKGYQIVLIETEWREEAEEGEVKTAAGPPRRGRLSGRASKGSPRSRRT
jgi:hypothetical protein